MYIANRLGVCSITLSVLTLGPVEALAQGQPTEAAATAQGLEEITVSARRREEGAQDIPISIAAFSSEDLEMRGMAAGRDINTAVPNVMIAGGGIGERDAIPIIRGLPGVGIYVDGVWQGATGLLQQNFVEMQRIEVLRGPQGTLFGRNTNGGAIQFITQRPAHEFGSRLELTLGEFSRRDIKASVDLPLHETLHTKITGASLKRDGFLHSAAVNRSFGGNDDQLIRGDALWEPVSNFHARLTATFADQHSTDARQVRFTNVNHPRLIAYNVVMQNPDYGPYDFAPPVDFNLPISAYGPKTHQPGFPGGSLGPWQTRSNQTDDGLLLDSENYTLTLNWNLGSRYSLESITAYQTLDSKQITDFDASEITMTTDDRRNYRRVFSQELHLSGSYFDDRLNFLAGGYYSDTTEKFRMYRWPMAEFFVPDGPDADRNPDVNIAMRNYVRAWAVAHNNPALLNFSPLPIWDDSLTINEDEDKAIFGEISYKIFKRLTGTVGLRWSWSGGRAIDLDPTEAFRTFEPGGSPNGDTFAGTVTEVREEADTGSIFTPKFSLSYEWTDDLMLYGSYAEGFTSSEVNLVENLNGIGESGFVSLDPEVVSTYEIGMRSEWLAHTLRFNATYFWSDWKGLRVPILPIDPATGESLPFPYNTDEGVAEASGLEIETLWVPNDSWQFNLALGLLNTKYLEVGDPAVSSLRPGLPFQYAPDFSGSVGAQYNLSLAHGGRLTFRGDYGYIGEYQRDAAVQRQTPEPEPAYGLLNARIRYVAPSGNWSLSAFGTNLTDERYINGGFDARLPWGIDFITVGRPREVGLSMQFTFE